MKLALENQQELEDWLTCPECDSGAVVTTPQTDSDGTLIECQDCGAWTRL